MAYVLLATIGQRPAAITMALDALLPRYAYEKVVLLHTDPISSGIAEPLAKLLAEMASHQTYQQLNVKTHEILGTNGDHILDIDTQHTAEAYFWGLLNQFAHYRRQGYSVHVLISGGRKAMSAYAVVAASYVLSYNDRLWTSMIPPDLMQENLWHLPVGRSQDINVLSLPFKASQLTRSQLDDIELHTLVWGSEYNLREKFLSDLTPTERKITEMIIQHPYDTDAMIGEHLQLSPKTVGNHLGRIYSKLEAYFDGFAENNKRFFLRDVLEGRF